jgi:hypothetical protein
LAPGARRNGAERGFAGCGVLCAVNVLERGRDQLAVCPGDEIAAVAQQRDDAGLHHGLRQDSGDRFREALQTVADGDQHVRDAAVLEPVHNAQPECRALVLFEPQPQDFLAAVGAPAARDVDGLVPYQPFIADLDPQRIKENQRVDRFPRAGQAAPSSSTASVTALIRSGEPSMP